jgi:N-acetylglucosamine-6-sulfatase
MMLRRGVLVGSAALITLTLTAPSPVATAQTAPPPNFVFVLSDDQSVNTLAGMANVTALSQAGAKFDNAIISNPLCCPSRAAILTGLYSHNNGVYTNGDGEDPNGGYPAFSTHGDQDRTFPLALQQAGYTTGLFGKYLNHYDGSTQPGWTEFHAFVGSNARYYDYDWTIDGATPVHHGSDATDYSTDVAGSEANAWLGSLDSSQPFFLYFAPYGPHRPRTPAPQDVGATTTTSFSTPAYNEADVTDKPAYIQARPLFRVGETTKLQNMWNQQYATLLSVDRWIGAFRDTLATAGTLDSTYFIFLSDNSITWGDHRWTGKEVPYERSIRVPMVIAGPTVQHRLVGQVVSNVDLAPTILDLAGVTPITTDGLSLSGVLAGGKLRRSGILLEHMGNPTTKDTVPSYCGFRTNRYMFTRYADDGAGVQEEELYNLRKDPFELTNIAATLPAQAQLLRDAAYAAGCDPTIVPPPTG